MAYTAYEVTAGDALDMVEGLCKHLTASGAFSTATQPTLAEVELWLTTAYGLINVELMAYGYDSGQTDTDIKRALMPFNAYWAAAQAEYSQASAGFAEGSSGRGDMLRDLYQGRQVGVKLTGGITALIQSAGFQRLGATKSEELSGHLAVGGISVDDKLTIKNDSDHTAYAFSRGMWDNKGIGGTLQETRKDLD